MQSQKAKNNYFGLRKLAFQINPDKIKTPLENDKQVYAGVVDMTLGGHTATLVCVIDGTTSLYLDTGGVMLGLGRKYKEVADESQMFLNKSTQVLGALKPSDDFSLPPHNLHNIFLFTKSGIYKTQIDPNRYDQYDGSIKVLLALYQRVFNAIQSCTQPEKQLT